MLSSLWKKIDKFLFEPISTNAVCIFRIGIGLSVVASAAMRMPDFLMWFGQSGISDFSHMQRLAFVSTVWNFVAPTDKNIEIAIWSFLLAGLLLTFGLFTRFATVAAFCLYTCFRVRNPYYWVSIDAALLIFLPILTFAPAGEKFSLDQLIRKQFAKSYKEKLHSPFAQRLLQFALTSIYIRGFLSKIVSHAWTHSTNGLNYSIHSVWMKHGLPRALETQWFYSLATWITLGIEFSLFTLIWFKTTRYWTLAIGVLFHLILNYSLNVDFLEYAMIASYVLFIYPEDLEKILQRLHLKASPDSQLHTRQIV